MLNRWNWNEAGGVLNRWNWNEAGGMLNRWNWNEAGGCRTGGIGMRLGGGGVEQVELE